MITFHFWKHLYHQVLSFWPLLLPSVTQSRATFSPVESHMWLSWCNTSNSTNQYAMACVPRQMTVHLYFYISRLIIFISPTRIQKDIAIPMNTEGKSEMKCVVYHSAKLCSLIFFIVVFALEHSWQILNVNVSRVGQSTNYAILVATIATFVFLNDFQTKVILSHLKSLNTGDMCFVDPIS